MKLDERLVRVDATGTAHPIGRVASRELRQRTGDMTLLAAPPRVAILRAAREQQLARSWLAGELVRPGMFWDILSVIAQGGWNGELVVVDQDGEQRALFVEAGHLVGASSTAERERLGRVLYQYGALTEEQLDMVLRVITPEVRFGEAAVALGYLTRERLFELIGRQSEEVLYATMQLAVGSFYFIDGIDEAKLPYRLRISLASLMMEGVRRMDEASAYASRIPSLFHVPARTGAPPPAEPELLRWYEAVDGKRSVDELSRALCEGSFDAMRAVFQLLQRGAVRVAPPRPTEPKAVVTIVNQCLVAIFAKVDATGGGAEVREQLASFATAGGVYDALFRDAGPAPDGSLVLEKIADNIELLVGGADGTKLLAQWLYEYTAFAMFVAEPLLRARLGEGDPGELAALSKQVAELLRAICE